MNHILAYDSALSFDEIVRRLEAGGGFLAVVDPAQRLMGVITDRDLRRAFLNGYHSLAEMLDRNPQVLRPGEQISATGHRGRYLPVVDAAQRLVDVVAVDRVPQHTHPHPVVIMAGGLGSRLGDLTRHMPKPMLPLAHKPVLHFIVDAFVEQGFTQFFFCIHYKAHLIREYFGDGSTFGAAITYIEEDQPLGTAGALSLLPDSIRSPFFVMNGDVVTTLNFEQLLRFHHEKEALATMCIHEYNQRLPYGVVHTRHSRILRLEEKPYHSCFINAGIYILDRRVLPYLDPGARVDMTTVFDRLVQAGEDVHAYVVNEYWIDIGEIEDYRQTQHIFDRLYSL
ncbi:MAG: nucleotidyltransferase family protein [Bacteroidia bacterium]